ncbi:MAG: hypothetical protein JW882_12785 [Deltaproteobacteria bacterium]|nr:hypothetical protein [Deltaproteobacteria bacterium]
MLPPLERGTEGDCNFSSLKREAWEGFMFLLPFAKGGREGFTGCPCSACMCENRQVMTVKISPDPSLKKRGTIADLFRRGGTIASPFIKGDRGGLQLLLFENGGLGGIHISPPFRKGRPGGIYLRTILCLHVRKQTGHGR